MPKFARFALATLCAGLIAGCARRETPVQLGNRTQTLYIGNFAEPADLDPDNVSAATDFNIDAALFEALTWIDERTSRAVPAAAEKWDVSADGRVYTFHLRRDGRWSNGDPVTAGDFAYAFRRILTPSFAAGYSYMLWPILNAEAYNSGKITDFSKVGVEVLSPTELRITLANPTPYLPVLAAHNTWMPVHRATIEHFGHMDEKGTKWTRPGNLVSNGAFVLKEWIPNGRITVERNPHYWDAAHVRLNRIVFVPTENAEAEEFSFRAGQLHVTYQLPVSKTATYQADTTGRLRKDPWYTTAYLTLNVTRPPLDNPKVRRALALGIDRVAIVRDVTSGSREVARALTPSDCAGYHSRAQVPDDFAEARRLLAEAGYPGGRGFPEIELQSFATSINLREVEAIQAMWKRELGVRVTIAPYEQKTLFQNQQSLNYAIGTTAWTADYPDPSTFLNQYVSGGGNNWSGWSNKQFDALIAAAATTADNARRYELFQQAEAIILEEAPIIPVYYDRQIYLIQPSVHGWEPSVLGLHLYKNVWLEP